MKKTLIISAAGAMLFGCATSQQQIDSHAPALNSWVGAPVEEFLDLHGTPSEMMDMTDYQIYKFDACKTKRVVMTRKNVSCHRTSGPFQTTQCETIPDYTYTITYACTYELVVIENVIKDWEMNGNNCKMMAVGYRPS